jgi:hypothetical protein
MPIQPIDLQTLFMGMNQVGKDKASEKDTEALDSTNKAAQFIKKAEEQSKSTVQTDATERGVERVKDGRKKYSGKGKAQERGKEGVEDEATPEEGDAEFKDPNLGHHIDISG